MGLGFPVALITETTGATGAARVARVNHDHPDARHERLVADEDMQLSKGPIAVAASLRMADSCSLSNMRQLFERECLAPFHCLCDQAFADAVIGIFLKAPLPAREFAETTLAIFCADCLQALPSDVVVLADAVNLCSAECLTIAIGCKVDNAQVHTQYTKWLVGFRQLFGLREAQIPDIATPDQLSAADLPGQVVEILSLEVAQVKLTDHTPGHGVEAHAVQWHQTVGSCIVADAAVGAKGGTRHIVVCSNSSDRFGGFVSGTTGKLSPKAKLRARRAIDDVMERVLVGDALLPRNRCTVRCSCVECGLSLAQFRISRAVNAKFTTYGTCGDDITPWRTVPHKQAQSAKACPSSAGVETPQFPGLKG